MVSYSRTCPQALFSFLILLLVTCTTSDTVPFYFQSSLISNCYTSLSANCSLINPAFWFNGTVPSSPDDALYVLYNDTIPVSLFLVGTTLKVASLTVSGVISLELDAGSFLEVANLTFDSGAQLVVNDVSTVQLNGTSVFDNAQIVLGGNDATYDQKEGWFFMGNMSKAVANANTTLSLSSAEIDGDLFLNALSNFAASTIYFNESQSIDAVTTIGQANFNSVNVNFTNGASIASIVSYNANIYSGGNIATNTIFASSGGSLEVAGDLHSTNMTSSVPVTILGNLIVSNLETYAPLAIYGTLSASNVSIAKGSTNIFNGVVADNVLVKSGASLGVSVSFAVSTSLNVGNSSSITLRTATAFINSTTLGAGDILVNASSLTLNSSYSLPNNSRLTFEGECTITAPSVNVYDFLYSDSSTVVHVIVTNGIQLNQSITFPGSMIVSGVFNAVGSVTVVGPLTLTQTTSYIQGNFAPIGGLYMNSTIFTIADQSSINSTTFVVGPNSTVSSVFHTSIYASLVNNGKIITDANNPLDIYGKYTQMKTATLQINNLNRGLKAFVTVTGSATIAGALSYQPLVIASGETVKLPVLVTTQGVSGKFNDPTRPFEQFSYSEKNNVYLIFSESNSGQKLYLSWAFVVLLVFSLL